MVGGAYPLLRCNRPCRTSRPDRRKVGHDLSVAAVASSAGLLMMLDHDESALHGVQLSNQGTALLNSPDTIPADIGDAEVVQGICDNCRPEVVFHAAALKHLPMLEQYTSDAWKATVVGTPECTAARRPGGGSR